MAIKLQRRVWGEGVTKIMPHEPGPGPGVHESGEILFERLNKIEDEDLGYYSEASEFVREVELLEDEAGQEVSGPLQMGVVGEKATLSVTMEVASAENLARALGYAQPSSIEISGYTYNAVVGANPKPVLVSLLHIARNPHTGKNDYLYIPRAQVEPRALLSFRKKEVRQARVTFRVLPSQQAQFERPDGTRAGWWMYYETTATFDRAKFYQGTYSGNTWDLLHNLGKMESACFFYETPIGAVFSDVRLYTKNYAQAKFEDEITGWGIALAAGVSSEEATSGKTYIHRQWERAEAWSVSHNLGQKHVVVKCYDIFGREFIPEGISLTDDNNLTVSLNSPERGFAVVIAEGASGSVVQTFAAATTWQITHTLGQYVAWMCYDDTDTLIFPDAVQVADNGDGTYTITFSFGSSVAGTAIIAA